MINWNQYYYKTKTSWNYNALVAGSHLDRPTLKEIWYFFVDKVVSENSDVKWDHVCVEFWVDAGMLSLFPGSTTNPGLAVKSLVYVVFDQLLRRYESLADSDIEDD